MPIVNPTDLAALGRDHWLAFCDLAYCEHNLNQRFVFSNDQIRALVLSVASGEPLLLVGPPGTGKSALIRAFCHLAGLYDLDEPAKLDGRRYFDYLLTPFTEPGELFGFYDIGKLQRTYEMVRMDDGMMQHAEVIYLDEVFNGSSAILNSILTFLNERFFHDRGQRYSVPWKCFFGATNEVPENAELRALFDRFVLRCWVRNVGDSGPEMEHLPQFRQLLAAGFPETYGHHTKIYRTSSLLAGLEQFRQDLEQRVDAGRLAVSLGDDQIARQLTSLVSYARMYGLSQVSNRRLIKMVNVMMIHAIYRSVRALLPDEALVNYRARRDSPAQRVLADKLRQVTIGEEELRLFLNFLADRRDTEAIESIHRMVFLNRG